MVEPMGYSLTLPRAEKRVERARASAPYQASNRQWLLEAAPFAVAALWIAATGAAMLLSALTGWREPLELCRSEAVLTTASALAALALLAGSVRRLMK